jgi:uncharacterized protein (DUF924 family)
MAVKREHPPEAADIDALLDFWFDVDVDDAAALDRRMRRWFASTADEDHELSVRFGALARDAALGRLDGLAGEARGRLALIVLLDQFPRNLKRGEPGAFAEDGKALVLCLDGMRLGHPAVLAPLERVFFCMPLQHAEDRALQALAVETFAGIANASASKPLAAALRKSADYAVAHRDIVERFGRFPHRNRALGRESTPAELEFLASGGASFGQ